MNVLYCYYLSFFKKFSLIFSLFFNQSGNPVSNQSGNPVFNQSGNPVFNQCGNPVFNQCGNPVFNQSGNPVFNESGNPVFNQSGNPVFNQSGNPVFNQSGNPGQSGNYTSSFLVNKRKILWFYRVPKSRGSTEFPNLVVLPSSQFKICNKSVKGSMSYDRSSKQTNIHAEITTLLIWTPANYFS